MAKHFTIPQLPGLRFPWYSRMRVNLWRPLRQFVYVRDNGKCQYCGIIDALDKCHIHHVLELSEGGTNHPSNLKVLCRKCHVKRHPFMESVRDRLRE